MATTSDPERAIDLKQSFLQLKAARVPVLLFVLTFAFIAATSSLILRGVEPAPDLMVLSPKLNHFQSEHENYNTVFLGTSRTFYHIVPDEVEQAAAAAGCPGLSVFNFGVFGLTGAEQDWILTQILDTPELGLDYLIIEDPLPAGRTIGSVTTERARYFHAPGLYQANLDNILSFPESTLKRVYRTGVFGYGLVHDLSGVGRLSKAVFPPAKPKSPFDLDFSLGGFQILGSSTNAEIEARRADFTSQPAKFAADLALYNEGPESDPAPRAQYHIERLEKIRRAGIRTGLFVSPDSQEVRRTPWIGQAVKHQRPDMMVLNFNQPNQAPALFQRELWFDFSHLNETGANLLSQRVGRQMCAEGKMVP